MEAKNPPAALRGASCLLDLLFPPRCPFCGGLLVRGETLLCAGCRTELPWMEERDQRSPEFCGECASALWYRGRVPEAIHRYKFSGRACYAPAFGALTAQCAAERLHGEWDLVSFVPLSRRRLRRRGYDQAALLAKYTADGLGLPLVSALRKLRTNGTQSRQTSDSARRANVLGVYQVSAPERIAGQRILLVDDVVTTGATLSECARVLMTAGAARVDCVTLARAR